MPTQWDPEVALSALAAETQALDVNVHDPVQLADAVERIFRESAQVAAMSIVFTSLHEPNPRIRLDAAKYVVERATRTTEGFDDPLRKLVSDLYGHMATEGV